MPKVTFRFYEELNDFLPKQRRKVDFEAPFKEKRSIKDMIEALGVPHTEVDLILVDGDSVDFNYILQDEDRIKEKILDRIPPRTRAFCDEYVQCPSCDNNYWKGTHFIHMEKVLKQILD